MDYGKMLEFHKDSNADCTIAVLEVPWEEASRFGIMTADENNVITKFEEKPKEPKSYLYLGEAAQISDRGRSR